MVHPKQPPTSDLPKADSKIDATDESEAPRDDSAAQVFPSGGKDAPGGDVPRKRTHRGGKRKGKKSRTQTAAAAAAAGETPEDGEYSQAIPGKEETGKTINAKRKPESPDGSTGHRSTGQSIEGETIGRKRRSSMGDIDKRKHCERMVEVRTLIEIGRDALDQLQKVIEKDLMSRRRIGQD